MTRLALALGLLTVCAACGSDGAAVPSDWALVTSSCGYTFLAPPDIVDQEDRGFDSCVDRWLTDSCEINGVVAVVAGPPAQLVRDDLSDFRESTETIDGRTARLTTALNQAGPPEFRFLSSVFFAEEETDFRPGARVTAFCSTQTARNETLALLRSIRFSEGSQ